MSIEEEYTDVLQNIESFPDTDIYKIQSRYKISGSSICQSSEIEFSLSAC